MYKNIIHAAFVVLIFVTTNFGQRQGERFDEKWLIYDDCPVPYELVILSVKHYVGHIFMLTEGKYFNEKDLNSLFGCLSKKYPEFADLGITIFSDRDNLGVAIRNHFYPPPDSNPPDDTRKEDCENLKLAVRPCPVGYYRAVYFRFAGREFYDYSKNPQKSTMTNVNLKKPNKNVRK